MGIPISSEGDFIYIFNGNRGFNDLEILGILPIEDESIDQLCACISHESIHCVLNKMSIASPEERKLFHKANESIDQNHIFGFASEIDYVGISLDKIELMTEN